MTETFLIDKSLSKVTALKYLGISLEKRTGKYSKYPWMYIFNFFWLNLILLGAIGWFFKSAIDGETITSLTYVAPCITISYLANIKSLCVIIYNESVAKLISILRSLETRQKTRFNSLEKTAIVEEDIKFLHLVLKLLNFINWGLMIAFPSMPLIITIMNYIKTKLFNPLLPFLIIYPFDAYDLRVWPFVYITQIWSDVIVVLEVGYVDFVFFICSTYIRIQFKLVAYDIERVVESRGQSGKSASEDRDEFKARIEDLVKRHQETYLSVELLEKIYCKSTLYNFVSSSALICLSGFNVTTIEDKAFVVSFLCFLFMSLLQIYFLCLFGDMLMRASIEVSDAVYRSKWHLLDLRSAKMLLFMHLRAQKSSKVTAYGFADVNLRSFTKILSTAWSYFALLKTVYSSPRG